MQANNKVMQLSSAYSTTTPRVECPAQHVEPHRHRRYQFYGDDDFNYKFGS